MHLNSGLTKRGKLSNCCMQKAAQPQRLEKTSADAVPSMGRVVAKRDHGEVPGGGSIQLASDGSFGLRAENEVPLVRVGAPCAQIHDEIVGEPAQESKGRPDAAESVQACRACVVRQAREEPCAV